MNEHDGGRKKAQDKNEGKKSLRNKKHEENILNRSKKKPKKITDQIQFSQNTTFTVHCAQKNNNGLLLSYSSQNAGQILSKHWADSEVLSFLFLFLKFQHFSNILPYYCTKTVWISSSGASSTETYVFIRAWCIHNIPTELSNFRNYALQHCTIILDYKVMFFS